MGAADRPQVSKIATEQSEVDILETWGHAQNNPTNLVNLQHYGK